MDHVPMCYDPYNMANIVNRTSSKYFQVKLGSIFVVVSTGTQIIALTLLHWNLKNGTPLKSVKNLSTGNIFIS